MTIPNAEEPQAGSIPIDFLAPGINSSGSAINDIGGASTVCFLK
jgi:hypothetical protein